MITLLLPNAGLDKRANHALVLGRELCLGIEGQELREQLEYIGRELCNVLLQNLVEGREQKTLELRGRTRVGCANESVDSKNKSGSA